MASPQCEHGFTRIANELLDAFLLAGKRLTKREALVWLAILRLTYGFNKKGDFISVRRLEKVTGIRFDHVHETVWKLKERGLIHLEKRDGRLFLGINKDYSLWFLRKGGKGPWEKGRSKKEKNLRAKEEVRLSKGPVPKTGNKNGKELLPQTGTGKLPRPGNRPVTQYRNIKRQNTSLKTPSSSEAQGDTCRKNEGALKVKEDEVFFEWQKVFGTRLPERLKDKAKGLLREIREGRIEPTKIRLPLRYLEAFEPPRNGICPPPVRIYPGMKVSYQGRTFEIADGPCIFMKDGFMVEGTIRRLIQTGEMKVIGEKGGKR